LRCFSNSYNFFFCKTVALGPVTGGASWLTLISTTGGFIAGGASVGITC